jgi:hypothetical protein
MRYEMLKNKAKFATLDTYRMMSGSIRLDKEGIAAFSNPQLIEVYGFKIGLTMHDCTWTKVKKTRFERCVEVTLPLLRIGFLK